MTDIKSLKLTFNIDDYKVFCDALLKSQLYIDITSKTIKKFSELDLINGDIFEGVTLDGNHFKAKYKYHYLSTIFVNDMIVEEFPECKFDNGIGIDEIFMIKKL